MRELGFTVNFIKTVLLPDRTLETLCDKHIAEYLRVTAGCAESITH